jgi:hypothetical protein
MVKYTKLLLLRSKWEGDNGQPRLWEETKLVARALRRAL